MKVIRDEKTSEEKTANKHKVGTPLARSINCSLISLPFVQHHKLTVDSFFWFLDIYVLLNALLSRLMCGKQITTKAHFTAELIRMLRGARRAEVPAWTRCVAVRCGVADVSPAGSN